MCELAAARRPREAQGTDANGIASASVRRHGFLVTFYQDKKK
jgi:hypothetical protein